MGINDVVFLVNWMGYLGPTMYDYYKLQLELNSHGTSYHRFEILQEQKQIMGRLP